MPREARISIPGVAHHVVQRGNNRKACFVTKEDRHFYLYCLKRAIEHSECQLHAYVLMTNHTHLLVTPTTSEGLASMMKSVGQNHTQFMNKKYKRTGTLWEGRYKSCVSIDPEYVLNCYRYIELNPVRARMVTHPSQYQWTSYHENAEAASTMQLTAHKAYLALAASETQRKQVYRESFPTAIETRLLEEIRVATSASAAIGSKQYVQKLEAIVGRKISKRPHGRPRKQ